METDDRKKIMEKLALLDRAGLIPDYEKTTRIADVLAKELEPVAVTASIAAAPAAATVAAGRDGPLRQRPPAAGPANASTRSRYRHPGRLDLPRPDE